MRSLFGPAGWGFTLRLFLPPFADCAVLFSRSAALTRWEIFFWTAWVTDDVRFWWGWYDCVSRDERWMKNEARSSAHCRAGNYRRIA